MKDQIIGALLGLACGDALGAPAEFHDYKYIRKTWGVLTEMTGGGHWLPGEWTDDTALALCVAGGILATPDDPVPATGSGFLLWRDGGPKDIGNTTSSVFSAFKGDWAYASKSSLAAKSGKGAGNGSLMRTLPVALAYPDESTMLRQSARLSAMTHWDPQAEVCCALYNLWVQRLLKGVPMNDAWQASLSTAKRAIKHYGQLSQDTPGPSPLPLDFWTRMEGVPGKSYDQLQPGGYAGYVVDCLEAAVWCCLRASSVEHVIVLAVNLGGEADTIAAVAGGAAGACWGHSSIPSRWLSVLHERDRLEKTAQNLSALRRHQEVYSTSHLSTRPFEPVEVAEAIWTGRNPLTERDAQTLKALGVTHILDLRESWEWSSPGKFGIEALEAISENGLHRVNLPVEDMGGPTSAIIDTVAALFDEWLSVPKSRVYVHCRASRERTAAVLSAVFARKHGLKFDEALELLKSKRPIFEPLPQQRKAARQWLGETH